KLPHTLIAWNRLLAGRVWDPMVGRDVLVGALAGAAVFSIALLERILPPWFGAPAPAPAEGSISYSLASARHVPSIMLGFGLTNTTLNLEFLFMIVVSRAVFRRYWVAVALTYLVLVTMFTATASLSISPPGAPMSLVLAASGLIVALILYILLRWGLLAAGALGVVFAWLFAAPPTLGTTSWDAGRPDFGPAGWCQVA